MAQFRLTQKFAADIKVASLAEPAVMTALLDDWFIDVVRIHRRKVAMATHGVSRLTFLLPYQEIGGASSVMSCIPLLLTEFLYENNLEEPYAAQVASIFAKSPVFCKTVDRSVLGHMNELKLALKVYIASEPVEGINWDEAMSYLNQVLLSVSPRDYANPQERMLKLLPQT